MPLALKKRVDTLESVLSEFIVTTNHALIRLEQGIEDLKDEMTAFKDEMRVFKDEMSEFKDEMRAFKDEMRADRREMNRRWGDLANKMGTLVEDIAAPNCPGIAKRYFGIDDFDFFAIRIKKKNTKDRSMEREFDIVAQTGKEFIIVEVKSNPRQEYVDDFLRVLKGLYDYFPEAAEKRLIPVFASLYLPDNIVGYLTRNGIYAMGMKDDTMEILNFEGLEQ